MPSGEILDPYNLGELQPQMKKLGYHFQHTAQTPTTMKQAEDHARVGGNLPAVFLTDHQTNGIGREGRVWLDKPGASILVSQINGIKPNTSPAYVDLVALHVCRVINAVSGTKAQIKYPNDLVIGQQKLGGILVVNINRDGQYLATNTGIGNIHYTDRELEDCPTDYGATALDLHTPAVNRREGLVLALLGDTNGADNVPESEGRGQSNKMAEVTKATDNYPFVVVTGNLGMEGSGGGEDLIGRADWAFDAENALSFVSTPMVQYWILTNKMD